MAKSLYCHDSDYMIQNVFLSVGLYNLNKGKIGKE